MTSGPATNGSDQSAVWRIDRFELIYFNARHRRWQYFAQDPLDSDGASSLGGREKESAHRRQVRGFLHMVRKIVEAALGPEGSAPFVLSQAQKSSRSIPLSHPTFADWKSHWDDYLAYLCATASHEGLPESDLAELENLRVELGVSGKGNYSLNREAALSLLSLLPILEDWDTWGCFLRARDAQSSSWPEQMRFPPCGSAAGWFQPLSIAEIIYANSSDPNAKSFGVLEKTVRLQAACIDLSNPGDEIRFVDAADFFDYCKVPTTVADNNERYLYQCYSHFVDDLIQELSESLDRADEVSRDPRRYFVIAYPVQVAGRLHFLQAALTTTNPSASLKDLWNQWAPVHSQFWTPQCISTLEAELGRIGLSAFQYAAGRDLRTSDLAVDDMTEDHLLRVLATHIYHLFPVRSFEHRGNQGKTWHYLPYGFDPLTREGIPDVQLGYRWQDSQQRPADYVGAKEKDLIWFELSEQGIRGAAPRIGTSALQEPITQQRAIQTVEQQIDYLRELRLTLGAEAELLRRDQRAAGTLVRLWVESLPAAARGLLAAATDIQPFLDTEIDPAVLGGEEPKRLPSERFRTKARCLERFLFQALPQSSKKEWLDHLKDLATPTILELASLFFDTSLVKAYTHNTDVAHSFSGSCEDARRALEQGGFVADTYAALHGKLEQYLPARAVDLATAFASFKDHVRGLTDIADLKFDQTQDRPLNALRSEMRGDYFEIFGNDIYAFTVFPKWDEWLSTWKPQYQRDFDRFVKPDLRRELVAQDVMQSEFRIVGVGAPSGACGTDPVSLFLRLLWLPYRVMKPKEFNAQCNIFSSWTATAEAFARLYVVEHRRAASGGRELKRVLGLLKGIRGDSELSDLSQGGGFWSCCENEVSKLPTSHSAFSIVLAHRVWKTEEQTGLYLQ